MPNPPVVALDARLAGGDATGDSTYWTGLLLGLAQLNSGTRYLLFSNRERPKEIPGSSQFDWITLPSRSSRWWSLVAFPLAARKAGAGVIHTQYNLSPLAGKHGITTIHDVSFFIGPEWFPRRHRALLQRFVPASARRASRVITVSNTSRQEIEHWIPDAKGKVEVALNGPNPAIRSMPSEQARQKVRAETGIDGPYLLTVGTRWPRKNMRLAVEAAELLDERFPHRLAVTGKAGWGEEAAGRRAVPTGYVTESTLSALYSAADLYLAPSFHEGFGIPLLEAFVCGCPVLCSTGGALPEVAGDAGHVMKSWEARDWAATISDLLSDSSKLDAMRELGRRRAGGFSWLESARVHDRIYREVAG